MPRYLKYIASIDDVSAAELDTLDGITSTSSELNILDGVTASAAELNLLDGSVAGTAVASKALALGATKNVDTLKIDNEATLAGDINHDGTNAGFFGVTPTTRPTAITQTYATADKTHANMTSADLATTATTQTTPWGFASQAQGDAIATQLNALRADVIDLKQLVNSVIDDLQSLGLLQ